MLPDFSATPPATRLAAKAATFVFMLLMANALAAVGVHGQDQPPADIRQSQRPALAFIGLHGGEFEILKQFEDEFGLRLEYVSDETITREEADFAPYRIVFLQHTRDEDRQRYEKLFAAAMAKNPNMRFISISGLAEKNVPALVKSGDLKQDAKITAYYNGASRENLRRMLAYVKITYLGGRGEAQPPRDERHIGALYHPDHDGLFDSLADFLQWAQESGRDTRDAPRAVVTAHAQHLTFQQPRVVVALIRELEKQGALAVGMIDLNAAYEKNVLEFKPDVVLHTCHSRENVAFRSSLDAPHLHSIFFRQQSIDDWRVGIEGLSASEMAFHIVGQELLGAIEPQVGAGTPHGGGGADSFTPIDERIEHLVARATAWIRLRRLPNAKKKIAFVYYDREMGQAELMRGSATGMFLNAPRSLVRVLKRMHADGYALSRVPQDEDELLARMMDHGRQIGMWAPGVLDRLARSGRAALVPVETYQKWFEAKVSKRRRREVVKQWGEAPGKFMTVENAGQKYLVIPFVDLGNTILLPQPLRGEAHDTSLVHDQRVPPPHNYLATYFWLQEAFQANAVVHFGTHGTEFILPGKPAGLSDEDWPDIALGHIPNINPWVINNLGESSPVRRRAYAVLIDHLVPPSVNAELSDELLNLHNDIDKWVTLPEGALKTKFRETITQQTLAAKMDRDLRIGDLAGRLLTPDEIRALLAHLHAIHNETTPVSLHVLGEPPREDLLVPWLVTCLRSRFLNALGEVVETPPEESLSPGDRLKYLPRKGEEAVALVTRQGLTPEEAVQAIGGKLSEGGLPEALGESFVQAEELRDGFRDTPREIGNLLAALSGRFIPPGPGNSPDRNPAAVPTGRNMYVMNPEEVPTRPSWELGKQLVEQLLAQQRETQGRLPEKVAFTLNSFATFQDYGVMESQILYLMGIRPVWDSKGLVKDVELIPPEELGRRRIDVFISALGYYRDMLPTRMRLLDKAVRLAASTDEPENGVFQNSQRVRKELAEQGVSPPRAEKLSQARIFGGPPGQFGSAAYYYLVERSGQWENREDLMRTYLGFSRHVYTDGAWGDDAPETYNRHIQGTDVLLRSWSDRTRSPLSNKYDWYKGGSLSLAIKHLTGREPQWFLSDVRDPDQATMVGAEDALRRDYRVRLFNRKWIEGMMREGYAGADQVAVHVSNTMGWKIMRENSVSDDIWEEIVDIYVRDRRDLHIREWFEAENPFAFQEITEILLESARKGYWRPDEATLREIAQEYARSVARHGEGGGLRGGGNERLAALVEQILKAPGEGDTQGLLAAYQAKRRESEEAQAQSPRPAEAAPKPAQTEPASKEVRGQRLAPAETSQQPAVSDNRRLALILALTAAGGLLVLVGYRWRRKND